MPRRRRRAWINVNNRCYCPPSYITRCCNAHFVRREQDPASEPLFEAATARINRILDELAESNLEPDRHLEIILVENPDSGEDELALTWCYQDLEILVPDPFGEFESMQ